MSRLSSEQAKAYLQRWSITAAHELDELRRTPLDQKLRQLEALTASRSLFDQQVADPRERQELCARWARIRDSLGA